MSQDVLLVLTTCPDRDAADRLAARVVEARLAACVNVIQNVGSTYRWQGKVETDEEVLLLIKTTAAAFEALGRMVRDESYYELPELLAVRVEDGSRAYLDWLIQSVDSEES